MTLGQVATSAYSAATQPSNSLVQQQLLTNNSSFNTSTDSSDDSGTAARMAIGTVTADGSTVTADTNGLEQQVYPAPPEPVYRCINYYVKISVNMMNKGIYK